MISQRTIFSPFAALLTCVGIATACLWDKDTIADELQTRATQYDLVMGQFPSHGKAYYQKRISILEPEFNRGRISWDERNDLAVAYIRTEQFAKAFPILEGNLKTKPNDYHTLSNLGVFYKKTGDFTNAVVYMQRALQIKPEGHMGLGDWYLKRLEWSKRYELGAGEKPDTNFLGEKYSATKLEWLMHNKVDDSVKQRAQYLTKLIKNDRHFSDGYLVMGDLFWQIGDLNLAMRCYQHAGHLNHPNPEALVRRIDAIIYHWDYKLYNEKQKVSKLEDRRAGQKKIFLTELKQVEQWLSDFHAAEAQLVQLGKTPTFDETSARNKTKRFRPEGKATAKENRRR